SSTMPVNNPSARLLPARATAARRLRVPELEIAFACHPRPAGGASDQRAEAGQSDGAGDVPGVRSTERGQAAAASQQQRRAEDGDLVEEPLGQERPEQLGAALDHPGPRPAAPEPPP